MKLVQKDLKCMHHILSPEESKKKISYTFPALVFPRLSSKAASGNDVAISFFFFLSQRRAFGAGGV